MAASIERSQFGDTLSGGRFVTQDYFDFQKRHTTNEYPPIWDMRTKYEYYHDGALSSDLVCYEPPLAGTAELVHRRYRYFKLLYTQAVENFERCKKDSLDQVEFAKRGRGNVPTASLQVEDYLKHCKVRVQALKKELDAIDEQVSKLPHETWQREVAELEAKRVAELEQQHSRLLGLTL